MLRTPARLEPPMLYFMEALSAGKYLHFLIARHQRVFDAKNATNFRDGWKISQRSRMGFHEIMIDLLWKNQQTLPSKEANN